MTNLIGNAIKFTTIGGVTIDVKSIKKRENSAIFKLEYGIRHRIPKEKFETIFQSFSQADTTTTRKYGGTGLGLSITKRLLELQNSEIQLESEINKGSRFFFDLEFELDQTSLTQKSKKITHQPNNIEHFDGAKILLVEDNKINIMVAQKFLKKWGLDVDVAENGQIAVDKVKANDYELVLMDLDMPVMDGYEATKQIRALQESRYQKLPIIALSASAVMDFRTRAMEVGMVEYVNQTIQTKRATTSSF